MYLYIQSHTPVTAEIGFLSTEVFQFFPPLWQNLLCYPRISKLERIFEIVYFNHFTNNTTEQLKTGGCLSRSLQISAESLRAKVSGLPTPGSFKSMKEYTDINFITNFTRIRYFLRLGSAQYTGSLEMLQSNIIFK